MFIIVLNTLKLNEYVWLLFAKPFSVSCLLNDMTRIKQILFLKQNCKNNQNQTTLLSGSDKVIAKQHRRTDRQTHACCCLCGLVCQGSSHNMWAKGHVSLPLRLVLCFCQEFYFFLSVRSRRSSWWFVKARAGQDGGLFASAERTTQRFIQRVLPCRRCSTDAVM